MYLTWLKMSKIAVTLMIVLLLYGCVSNPNPMDSYEELTPTTIMDAPSPDPELAAKDPQQISHGKYLVELLGCSTCHTDGALIGQPDSSKRLAGSRVGIAYSNPLQVKNPGIVYPPNLTPDNQTGLGQWKDEEVVEMIREGTDRDGHRKLPVMPWPAYSKITNNDARAIAAYLRSLPAISHRVPNNVFPGSNAIEPYVHFGTYRSKK